MNIALVVASAENGCIGSQNTIPWRLSADLQYFKRLTTNHCVVMGRKTFASIGKPLPNRTNIVVSRNANLQLPAGCIVANSLNAALDYAKEQNEETCFVIGGAEIYRQALPLADVIYLTMVHAEVAGDAFFTAPDTALWQEVWRETHQPDEKNEFAYTFTRWHKKTGTNS